MNRLRSFLKTVKRKFLKVKKSPSKEVIDPNTVDLKVETTVDNTTDPRSGIQLSAIEYALYEKAPLFENNSWVASMAARKIDFDPVPAISPMNISVKGGYYPLPAGVIKARDLYVDQILTS